MLLVDQGTRVLSTEKLQPQDAGGGGYSLNAISHLPFSDQSPSLSPIHRRRRAQGRGRDWRGQLERFRTDGGMTKQQLADFLGIARATLYYWEKGKTPQSDHVAVIERKTGVVVPRNHRP